MYRKEPLVTGECYHVFNKSIAGYTIFNSDNEYLRMRRLFQYYQQECVDGKFTHFLQRKEVVRFGFEYCIEGIKDRNDALVRIVSYCIMPTHFHMILQQLKDDGISTYMRIVLDSYTKYFNLRNLRKGPLWVGRFKNRLIQSDEELLHVTRYIHLNPTSAGLVKKAEFWEYSSYKEYLGHRSGAGLCEWRDVIDMERNDYKKFVEDRQAYQRELALVKHLIIE